MCPYIYIVLPSYAVLAFLGLFCAVIFIFFRLEKFCVGYSDFVKMLLLCIIMAFLGSKLMYALTQLPQLIREFSLRKVFFLTINSGFVYYGGLFGTLLGVLIYARKGGKLSVENVYRMMTPGIPLFHCFGRIGCFMAGCCYGKEIHPPWVFAGSIVVQRIPTQLLEAFFELLLFIFLCILEKFWDGNTLKVYLFCYACFRFLIEFFRGDDIRGIWGGLSTAQWISVIILLDIICIHSRIFKKEVRHVLLSLRK